jgi:hypothetical protein
MADGHPNRLKSVSPSFSMAPGTPSSTTRTSGPQIPDRTCGQGWPAADRLLQHQCWHHPRREAEGRNVRLRTERGSFAPRNGSSTYNEGDELFLFSFSRGAYTARRLSGLIGKCGLSKASTPPARSGQMRRRWRSDGIRKRVVSRRLLKLVAGVGRLCAAAGTRVIQGTTGTCKCDGKLRR